VHRARQLTPIIHGRRENPVVDAKLFDGESFFGGGGGGRRGRKGWRFIRTEKEKNYLNSAGEKLLADEKLPLGCP